MKGMTYEELDTRDEHHLKVLGDEGWVAEQKMDGVRVMAHVEVDGVRFLGSGETPITFAAAAQWFPRLEEQLLDGGAPAGTVIDGELIISTGVFWAFDLPYLPTAAASS